MLKKIALWCDSYCDVGHLRRLVRRRCSQISGFFRNAYEHHRNIVHNLAPAQETIKCYAHQEKEGIMLPIICIRLPGTRDIRYSQTKLCFTFSLLITFTTKFYLRSEAYIS